MRRAMLSVVLLLLAFNSNTFAALTISNSVVVTTDIEATTYIWSVYGPTGRVQTISGGPKSIEFNGLQGATYQVDCIGIKSDATYQRDEGSILIGGTPTPPVVNPPVVNPPVVNPPVVNPPVVTPDRKVTQVTYVFEKDVNNLPDPVALALQKLNSDSIIASEFEEDTVNAAGQVPTQYKIALEAARKAGLPSLVVQAGDSVVRVVKSPATESQVLESVKP